ncbi:MAG: hypothetical protein Q4A04_05115 [Eubacteriales bacterium]|nr:hypothetical protein [Eubacteriales bacterium]
MGAESGTEKREYITDQEALTYKELFKRYLKLYHEKGEEVTDQEWLEELFRKELPDQSDKKNKEDAEEIISSFTEFSERRKSVEAYAERGLSDEKWVADQLTATAGGLTAAETGMKFEALDDALYQKNVELAQALERSSDGHINMNPNLDGNMAEHLIADTAELSGYLQGNSVKVEVREAYTANSVDVRAYNLKTGECQNYQLKFGKDAQHTIQMLESGNYNNQRIVVPKEQLAEIQEYYRAKGSNKTITDHIDAWGAKGKAYTKEEMKALQEEAQKSNKSPEYDYSDLGNKDLALHVGKNAGVFALQSAAIATGFNLAKKAIEGEEIEAEEMVPLALKTGADTSVKTVAAGALTVAVRRGAFKILSVSTPAKVISSIVSVGVENAKVLCKMASGELNLVQGIDQMRRNTCVTIYGIVAAAKGAAIGQVLIPIPIVGSFIGGVVGSFAGSNVGSAIFNAAQKIRSVVKSAAKKAVSGLRRFVRKIGNSISRLFGFA